MLASYSCDLRAAAVSANEALPSPFLLVGGGGRSLEIDVVWTFWPKGVPAGRKPLNPQRPTQGHQSAPVSL